MSTLLRLPTAPRSATTPLQPIHADRLIIATNRGPVEYYLSQQQTLKQRRGSGGVVTALVGAAKNIDVTWVAMAMTEGDRIAIKDLQQEGVMRSPLREQNMLLRYVAIPKNAYRKHYERVSNQLLWFVQHYMFDSNGEEQSKIQDAWSYGYEIANRAIADAVTAEIERGEGTPVVMLHDYHLYLAPAMIREQHSTIIMQQFIHIPWPDIRCWQLLPGNISQAIFNGLVGNDIIGFQTERDAHNFMEGARTILEGSVVDFESGEIWWKRHCTQVRAYPISISVTDEKRQAQSLAGRRAVERLKPLLEKQTIIRVDRIEPTKNILRGFQAYALMLEQHPELHEAVNFLAFLVPSRQTLAKYKRLGSDIEKLVNDINARFGTKDWKPITAFYENDRVQALAAMRSYDVLLVNPIIDGMNLVAKEGPVVNRQNGVLVLSRTAGAFQQLGKAAIPVTPTDVTETANALYQALTMQREERRNLASQARQAVEDHDLNEWLQRQFSDINALLDRLPAHISAFEAMYSVPAENAG
jgi:trehalose 6-phosphate synthase